MNLRTVGYPDFVLLPADQISEDGIHKNLAQRYHGDSIRIRWGGRVTNYLLEKSRLVVRANNERSFHVFYNVLRGLDDGNS